MSDPNEPINPYGEDDDFPDYANEQNKELNQIVIPKHTFQTNNMLTVAQNVGEGESQISGPAGTRD